MKNVLFIDSKDIYTEYGVSISDTAYDGLVCLPELKPIQYNDWHEKNGIDPDLSAPVIAAKKVTIPFSIVGSHNRYKAFLEALSDGSYHSFNFKTIGLTKELRLFSCGDLKSVDDLSSFSLVFYDDDPMKGYSYIAPSSKIEPLGDFFLDGVDIAAYGLRTLKGTMDSIKKSPDVKENLKRDISVSAGNLYDGKYVVYKTRTAKIRCLMRAANASEFWKNRNALLYDLTKPGERTLTVTELGKDVPCFYKGFSVKCFYPDNGKFWFEFELSLEFFKGVI